VKLLLDTHAFLWWLADDRKLHRKAREAIEVPENPVFVSAATIWEIAIKIALGKLEFEGDPVEEIALNGFLELPMSARHAREAGRLPRHHDDPFDRMLIAQARLETKVLVTRDAAFDAYGVEILPT